MAAPTKRDANKLDVQVWTTVSERTRRVMEHHTRQRGFTVAGWVRTLIHDALRKQATP